MRRYDYVPNRGSAAPDRAGYEAAKRIREAFEDRPVEREIQMGWQWPRTMRRVGECVAVMYSSAKWQSRRDHLIDYKHVAEGPQRLLVKDTFLRDYHRPGSKLPVDSEVVDVDGPMPQTIAQLAPILGIQAKLYSQGEPTLYQINIANAWLGAAEHPRTGRTFLLVYTKSEGPCCLITGTILDVEKDGIVG